MKPNNFLFLFCICLSFTIIACKFSSTDLDTLPGSMYYTGDIRIANIDGTNERKLVYERIQIHYANFLPNGQKIVFVQEDIFGGPLTLSSINPDGSDRRVVQNVNYFPHPNFIEYGEKVRTSLLTPDSRYLLYIGYDDNARSSLNIQRVAIDGGQITNLTQVNTAGHRIVDMVLSDDGQRIVYSEYEDNNGQVLNDEYRLCMIAINGGQRQVLKTIRGFKILFPQFIPTDNNSVAYVIRSSQNASIGALHRTSVTDTSDDKIMATVIGECTSTAISADGKLVYLDSTYLDSGYFGDFKVVDFRNGTVQILKKIHVGDVLSSVDKTMLQIRSFSSLWVCHFDGSATNSFTVNTAVGAPFVKGERFSGAGQIQRLYFSPDNRRIIYVVSASREVWS